jgi:dTDP-4-amino-4,6-dideoxygalactose transaminase
VIRLAVPSIEEDDLQAVREALASGRLVQGERVAEFERTVANCVGCKHAVAVTNCTAALHLSLLALGVGPGDIVIVTAYSWISTANVIELCGAQPVFVDIDRDTFNLDPNRLEDALVKLMKSTGTATRVKAILPVHAFGLMADMPKISDLAQRFDLPIVEDAACALGASCKEKKAGTWGIMGCFSFHPRKAVTTGEGGMITTDDSRLADRLRALRNHGQDPGAHSPDFIMPGFNCRMTEFQAALGLSQMAKLGRIITARRRLARNYDSLLACAPVFVPEVNKGSLSTYQSYVGMLKEGDEATRNRLIERLKEEGVETAIGTVHMPLTSYFRSKYGYQGGDFPVTDHVAAHSIALPLHEQLSSEDQENIVNGLIREIYRLKGAL